MKRTYPTNVDGQIFYIDEDAFALLQNYLQELKNTFKGTEGEEIVGDIESRFRERFNEKITAGAGVITVGDVENVIETMGRPEDLSGEENADASLPHNTESSRKNEPFISINLPQNKKLYRDVKNKVFGGVFGGLASYLGFNANIMRLLFVVLMLGVLSYIRISPLVLVTLYLIAWMIIPPALTPRQILQMKGTPVNIDTVGQAVMAEAGTLPPPYKERVNFFSELLSITGKCIIGFIGLVASTVTLASLLGVIALIIACIALLTSNTPDLFQAFSSDTAHKMGYAIGGLLLSFIFSGWLSYGCILAFFNLRPVSKNTAITLSIVSAMLAAIAIIALCFAL